MTRWAPVLDGPLADAARDAVLDIAVALAAGEGELRTASDSTLFWAYITELDERRFDGQLEHAVESTQLELDTTRLAAWGGLAGTGFAIAHVNDQEAAAEVLAAIDERLVAALSVECWESDYDVISGLVGYGVYLLERIGSSSGARARGMLDRIVEHLVRSATITEVGTTWHTAAPLLPAWQRDRAPDGYYNCGVAHGVPGVIALLARLTEIDGIGSHVGELCDDATRWLLAQRLPAHPNGRFPAYVVPGESPSRTRAAWCYGDPGIAAVLWNAAARQGHATTTAIELAHEAVVRRDDTSGVVDAGLCHGAAGLGHLSNRYYQASRDPMFRDAARRWFARALALRSPAGLAGFLSIGGTDRRVGRPSANLLEGAVGIGLALMAAISSTEPAWDRMLLCDIPPIE